MRWQGDSNVEVSKLGSTRSECNHCFVDIEI